MLCFIWFSKLDQNENVHLEEDSSVNYTLRNGIIIENYDKHTFAEMKNTFRVHYFPVFTVLILFFREFAPAQQTFVHKEIRVKMVEYAFQWIEVQCATADLSHFMAISARDVSLNEVTNFLIS